MASDISEIKRRVARQLRKLPNVNSVGIGGQETNGRPTGKLVIKVFVDRKMPPSGLEASSIVPPTVMGIPTDVVERPAPELQAGAPGKVFVSMEQIDDDKDTASYRPIEGGSQLQARAIGGEGTLGLIGKAVIGGQEKVVAVTAAHVLGQLINSVTLGHGTIVVSEQRMTDQPKYGRSCTCCNNDLGSIIADSVIYDPQTDVGLVEMIGGIEYHPRILGIGVVRGTHDITHAEAATLGYEVRKRGRTTRLTGGTVQAIEVEGAYDLREYTNGIEVKPNPDTNDASATVVFSADGDSGAALVNSSNEICGIHVAGNKPEHPQFGWGSSTPIAAVTAALAAKGIALTVETTTDPAEKRTVPSSAAAGVVSGRLVPDAAARELPELVRLQDDLMRSERGRRVLDLYERHHAECQQLINGNRRVAVGWHRAGGPALFQQLFRMLYSEEARFPAQLDGRPLDQCACAMIERLAEHGSPALRRDAERAMAQIPDLRGLTYEEAMTALDSGAIGPLIARQSARARHGGTVHRA